MIEEWREAQLSEVMRLDLDLVPVSPDEEYPIVGVLNRGRGLLRRGVMRGSSTQYKHLHRLRKRQVIYSKLKAFEGSVTVAIEGDYPAFASPEFPTFTCSASLIPEFFGVITRWPRFWAELEGRSTGMGGRRERVSPTSFLGLSVPLPPVKVQRRIVDVAAAVDAQIAHLEDERAALDCVLRVLRDDVLAPRLGWHKAKLSDITTKIGSGATPRGGEAAYKVAGTSLIRSQNVHDGRFVWEGLARIDDEQAQALDGVTVVEGDALTNITGASVNRTCVVPAAVLPARVNQHVAILRPDPKIASGQFLSQSLRRSDVRQHLDRLAGAGTTRQAITKFQLQELALDLPPTKREQDFLSDLLETVEGVSACLDAEPSTLRRLRSTLVDSLLSRDVELPEAYDQLLDGGVA